MNTSDISLGYIMGLYIFTNKQPLKNMWTTKSKVNLKICLFIHVSHGIISMKVRTLLFDFISIFLFNLPVLARYRRQQTNSVRKVPKTDVTKFWKIRNMCCYNS